MSNNFEKVCTFNKVFGLPHSDELQKNVFSENPKLVKLRLDLITEEVKELQEAIENHDMKETIDALADILYVVYGAGSSFGIDLNKAFDIVHDSNMSKSCKTEEQAIKSVEQYKELYKKKESPYDSPAYRFDEEVGLYIIYNKSTGKILKNKDYVEADFSEMLQ
jgi:predicted HAD superfamily Cof-like phosphohydrolase